MSITHRISRGCNDGSVALAKTEVVASGADVNLDEAIPTESLNLAVAWAFTKAKLQSIFLLSDQNITLYTNSVGAIKQIETATVLGAITLTGGGNATVIVTASGMTGTPRTVTVAVANSDTAALVAGKIRVALAADVDVGAWFTVSGTDVNVVLTVVTAAANDGTMNINIDNGTCAGLTTAATSANTRAGHATGGSDTITLLAGQPIQWTALDAPFLPNPFAGNITSLFVVNISGATAQLQIRALVDPT